MADVYTELARRLGVMPSNVTHRSQIPSRARTVRCATGTGTRPGQRLKPEGPHQMRQHQRALSHREPRAGADPGPRENGR
jgi:hypothetical protein